MELGFLLSVIVGPMIQNAFVAPEVYSTFVAETEQFLEVGLHRRQLLPLVVLVMILLIQQVPDVIVIAFNRTLMYVANIPDDLVYLVGRLSVLDAEQNVFTLKLAQLRLSTAVTSASRKLNITSHDQTLFLYWVTQTNERSSHLRLHPLDSSSPPRFLPGHQRPAWHAAQVT